MRRLKRTVLALVFIAVWALSGELYLRWGGYKYQDSALGFMRQDYRAVAREEHGHSRLDCPSVVKYASRKNALVLGCSFTYGMGVAEQDTFCWKLNDMQSKYHFHNRGIPGVGVGTALLDLPYQLEQQSCAVVLYAVIANHVYREGDMRVVADLDSPTLLRQNQSRYLSSDHFPILLNGKLHRLDLFWLHRRWWGEDWCRLLEFAHLVWVQEQNNLPDDDGLGMSLAEKRFCRNLRSVYTMCAQKHLPFIVVNLAGFNADRLHDNPRYYCQKTLEEYLRTPLTVDDVVPDVPIINAEYPVDYLGRADLHTKPGRWDIGDHPSAVVHAYYAEKIWAGMQELERDGKL